MKMKRGGKLRLKGKAFYYLLCFMSILFVMSSCNYFKDIPDMDKDKCNEVAMQYLKEKYHEDFESFYTAIQFVENDENMESVEVAVWLKTGKTKQYHVIVYNDGHIDNDEDGYCDSYKVVSDNYMRELIQDAAREDMEELLRQSGLNEFKIKILYISEVSKIQNFDGFSPQVPIPDEKFSLEELLNNYPLDIYCCLAMPESAYSNEIKNDIINIFRPKLGSDEMWFEIEVYTDKGYENNYSNESKETEYADRGEKRKIKFSVKEKG